MNAIIFSDVFGITPALIILKEKIGANSIIDPYEGEYMDFKNEAEAYSYFVNQVGLDRYVSNILNALSHLECKTTLIGFSIGASAIWRLSHNNTNDLIEQGICFYGSQIRHQTNLSPKFDVRLIFPRRELHFDVQALKCALANKPRVTIEQADFLHGFMNYHSENFNSVGYQKYLALLLNDSCR